MDWGSRLAVIHDLKLSMLRKVDWERFIVVIDTLMTCIFTQQI